MVTLSQRMTAIADYNKNFPTWWNTVVSEYRSQENKVWLAGPTSYVFSLAGEKFAVDLQIRRQEDFDKILPHLIHDTEALSAILITHEHDDHMCSPLMTALKDTPIHWYIPADCRRELVFQTGLPEEKITWVSAGDSFSLGKVQVNAFYTPHGKPGKEPVMQRGYEIVAPNRKILIPGDIRDYDYADYPAFSDVDLCISHLWAGNDALNPENYMPLLRRFVKRSAEFGAKKYFLCHLYEIARTEEFLWHHGHAQLAIEEFSEMKPDCKVEVPVLGQGYEL